MVISRSSDARTTSGTYGSAATLLKADPANCSSSIHERLYESVSQDPWIAHWAARCPRVRGKQERDFHPGNRFDGKIPNLDLIPEGSYFQSCPDFKSHMKTRLYRRAPDDPTADEGS